MSHDLPPPSPASPSAPPALGYCPTCRLPLTHSGHRQCACSTTTLLVLVVSTRGRRVRAMSPALIDALARLPQPTSEAA